MGLLDRLSCEVAIWAEVVVAFGLAAFDKPRSDELLVPEAVELSRRSGIPLRPLVRAYDALRKAGVMSARVQYRHGYIIKKPKRFREGLRGRLTRRLGVPVALSFPPYLRGKEQEEILRRIDIALTRRDGCEYDVELPRFCRRLS